MTLSIFAQRREPGTGRRVFAALVVKTPCASARPPPASRPRPDQP